MGQKGKFVAATIAAMALATVPSANAAYPGQNGKLAFSRDGDGDGIYEIWTINPDGSDLHQLTHPPNRLIDRTPAWSPDGKRIAFTRSAGLSSQVWVVEADGSGEHPLTAAPNHNVSPSWSPDGARIAFSSNRIGGFFANEDIWVMNADGSNPLRLTDDPGVEEAPAWSPSGDRIVFQAQIGGPYNLWTIRPDGTELANLTNARFSSFSSPDWSPTGDRIAFDDGTIGTVNADGTARTRITGAGNFDPAWSPDGTKIAFGHLFTAGDIWTMNPDGSGQAPVAILPGPDQQPDWQPIPNRPPDCSHVGATPRTLWPPNHKLVPVSLAGATDPDGDSVTITVTGVTSDEASGDFALGPGSNQVSLRAERDPHADGRVYSIAFRASDGKGGECGGTAAVSAPHNL